MLCGNYNDKYLEINILIKCYISASARTNNIMICYLKNKLCELYNYFKAGILNMKFQKDIVSKRICLKFKQAYDKNTIEYIKYQTNNIKYHEVLSQCNDYKTFELYLIDFII